jgi:hypothetical protein
MPDDNAEARPPNGETAITASDRTSESSVSVQDGDGAFAVSADGRYYMEYISLPKLLADAKARNSAFFRRLGLAD